MKKVLTAVLWIVSILLGYLIYQSIMAPIEFNKTREERFTAVIERLKEIKVAQEAYKTVNGKYAGDFEGLVQFIDTAEFTITQQRDSSFMRYNRVYRIDMQVDTVVIDTLGRVSIKDSLFKNSMSYKRRNIRT